MNRPLSWTRSRSLGIAGLAFLCGFISASACRYNVHDVGFVDVGDKPYKLYLLLGPNATADQSADLKATAAELLRDTNIIPELLPRDRQPARRFLAGHSPRVGLPAGVLESPDGQMLAIALHFEKGATGIRSALEALVQSPVRNRIVEQASRSFAVVLLIEGRDPTDNQRARDEISRAIQRIQDRMKHMPKRIARPPVMVALPAEALRNERILLWSLGLDAKPVDHARAVILYGQTRWLGPVINGPEISEGNLTGIMSIIGEDCECGLDLSWTRGTPMPVRWNLDQRKRVVRTLGFDPENPLVRMEIANILDRSKRLAARLSSGDEARANQRPPGVEPQTASIEVPQQNPTASAIASKEPRPRVLLWSATAMAGLVLVTLAALGWILWRSTRRKNA